MKDMTHEGGLHSGHHPDHLALVDIAHQTALLRALDADFLQDAVIDPGDPGFRRRDVDQYLSAHTRLSPQSMAKSQSSL